MPPFKRGGGILLCTCDVSVRPSVFQSIRPKTNLVRSITRELMVTEFGVFRAKVKVTVSQTFLAYIVALPYFQYPEYNIHSILKYTLSY